MTTTTIGDALFTKRSKKVVGLLFGKPDKRFYTNEIMRWVDMGRGTVSRELEKLVAAEILFVTKTGNQNHYQANAKNPIYSELVSIVKKNSVLPTQSYKHLFRSIIILKLHLSTVRYQKDQIQR